MSVSYAVDAETAAAQAAVAALERTFTKLGTALSRVQAQFNPGKAAIASTATASATASTQINRMGSAIDQTNKKTRGLIANLTSLRGAMGAAVGAMGIGALANMSDEYTNIENKLRLVTKGSENLKAVNDALFASANKTRTSWEANADLYGKIARNSEQLGLAQTDVLKITEAVSQTMAISGASASESASGIKQLGQALASGTLRGDELNTIMENTPRLSQAIAQGMGLTIGQLRQYGKEGKLNAKAVSDALLGQADKIAGEFKTMTPTIAQSFTVLRNNVVKMLGDFNQASGAAGGVSVALLALAGNLDVAAVAGAGLGVAMLAMNGPKIINGIKATTAALRAMSIAATANPIGLAIAAAALAVSGLVIAFNKLAPKIKVTSDGAVSLKDFFVAAFQIIGEKIGAVAKFFTDVWNGAVGGVWGKVADFVKDFGSFMAQVGQFVGRVAAMYIDHWVGSFNAIRNVFSNFPAIMADIGISAINGLITIIEQGVNKIANAISKGPLAAFLNGKGGGEIKLGRVANPYEGSARAVGEAYGSGQGSTQRAAGAVMGAVRGAAGEVTDRARANNANRGSGGISDQRGTAASTPASGDKNKKGSDEAAKAAEKAADALADLNRAIQQVGLSEKQEAAIQALSTAGLEDRVRIVDGAIVTENAMAQSIIDASGKLFDARKRHEDMTAATERLATARQSLRSAELDLMAVQSPAQAASARAREEAKLEYDASMKAIEKRNLSNEVMAEEIRLANELYAAKLRVIAADEQKAATDFGKNLKQGQEDTNLDTMAIRNPEEAERQRALLEVERNKQRALEELNALTGLTKEQYDKYLAEIEALSDQQVINIEENIEKNKASELFKETEDLFTDIFSRGEDAMIEFFIKLIAQQLKAIAYAKIMGTTMQQGFQMTGGGSGGGIGGFVSSFIGNFLKGGKSGGGPISAGGIYPVGMSEASKTELMFAGSNGHLMSNSRLRKSLGDMGGGGNSVSVTVNLPPNYDGNPNDVGIATRIHTERAISRAARRR